MPYLISLLILSAPTFVSAEEDSCRPPLAVAAERAVEKCHSLKFEMCEQAIYYAAVILSEGLAKNPDELLEEVLKRLYLPKENPPAELRAVVNLLWLESGAQ